MKPSAIIVPASKIEAELIALIKGGRLMEIIEPIQTFIGDLGGLVEAEARALADAGRPDDAINLLAKSYEFCRTRFTQVIYYMNLLTQKGRHDDALAIAARARTDMPDNVWIWYWSIWSASQANQPSMTDGLVDLAYAKFPEAPEIVLAHTLHLKGASRYSELIQIVRQRKDFQIAFPDIAVDLVIGESIASDNVTAAARDWLDFPRTNIKPEVRFAIAFRLMSASLKDAECAKILGNAVYEELSELAQVSSGVLNDICGRIGSLYYTDKAGFQALKQHSAQWLAGLKAGNAFARMLQFLFNENRQLTQEIRNDIIASADNNDFILAYFYLSPEWSRVEDMDFANFLSAVPDHPERQFLAQLFELAYPHGYRPVLQVNGEKSATKDGGGALNFISRLNKASDSSQIKGVSIAEDSKNIPTTALSALQRIQQNRQTVQNIVSNTKASVSKRPLKIGMCVSGQLRGFEEAYPSWSKLGLDQHNVDVVVHTWQDIGRKTPTAQNLDRCFSGHLLNEVNKYFLTRDLGDFMRQYPLLTQNLAQAGKVTEAELQKFYAAKTVVVEDDTQDPFRAMPNSQKMYYKIKSAANLLNSADYDLIIRIRPDISINFAEIDWYEVHRESRERGCYFSDAAPLIHLEMGVVYADQFAVGVPEVMDIYAQTYDFQMANGGKAYQVSQHYLPHSTLMWATVYCGLEARGLNGFVRGPLLSPGPLSASTIYETLVEDVRRREPIGTDKLFIDACSMDMNESLGF